MPMYVSKDGNDANNGSSWALAKLTIQSAVTNIITNGDTILIGAGLYSENVSTASKTFSIMGVGDVTIDGSGGIGMSLVAYASTYVIGNLNFQNCSTGLRLGSVGAQVVGFCNFTNCTVGIDGDNTGMRASFNYNGFFNCGTGINIQEQPAGHLEVGYSTFVGNAKGIAAAGNNASAAVIGCLFASNTIHYELSYKTGLIHPSVHNNNVFDYINTSYKCRLYPAAGPSYVDITSFATLQNYDSKANEIASVHLNAAMPFVDAAKKIYYLQPNASILSAGPAGNPPGRYGVGIGFSTNVNASTFNNPYSSTGLTLGAGVWALSSSPTGTYVSSVIDMGARYSYRKVIPIINMSPPTQIIDYSIAESAPRKWTYRYRSSSVSFAASDVSPTWIEAELGRNNSPVVGRYFQFEFVLRDNGA